MRPHRVVVVAAKPFAQHQKNDRIDAAAICRAVRQPNMTFVPGKTLEQQDIQTLHRGRQRLVKTIVAVANKNARVIFAMLKKGTEFRAA